MFARLPVISRILQQRDDAVQALADSKRQMQFEPGHFYSPAAALSDVEQRFSGLRDRLLTDIPVIVPRQHEAAGMRTCYQAANVTVVTSEYETFGRVAAESMFCGTPVIAFDTGGLPEIVVPGESGWLVPFGDIAKLSSTLKDVMENSEELSHIGIRCTEWANRRFSLKPITDQYLAVYRQTIESRSSQL